MPSDIPPNDKPKIPQETLETSTLKLKKDEMDARALLESKGFLNYTLSYKPDTMLGLRWRCEILGVWAPILHGRADGIGFTAIDAALKALACRPIPLSQDD